MRHRHGKVELRKESLKKKKKKGKFIQVYWRWQWSQGPGAPMAGSEEPGLQEDTLRVLAAFLSRGEAAGSPIPTPPR